MKERFLSFILAFTLMFSMFTSLSVMAEKNTENTVTQQITKTYADINFDNWTSHENNINSDGSSLSLAWAGKSYSAKGAETVSGRDGKSYKIDVKAREDGATGHYVRWRQTDNVPASFSADSVLWTEFSVKYEGQFVGVGIEHNLAIGPFNINREGKLERFTIRGFNECGQTSYSTYTRGKSIGDYQLELGKWYRFVIALDFTKDTGSGAPLYVWMNGKAIETGTDTNSNLSIGKSFKYNKFWVDAIDPEIGGTASVYIDNYKVYETSCMDNHAENEYEADPNEQVITKTYANMNFDNWTSSESNLNSDGTSSSLVWAGNAYNNRGPENVEGKSGKVYKFEMKPRTDGTYNHFVRWRQGQGVNVPAKFGGESVLWTEFSVKYEEQFVGMGIEHDLAVAPFNINKDGKLERFTMRGFYECGAPTTTTYKAGNAIGDYQLELGKWYTFVIALDFTKDTGSGAPLYIWMNGKQIENGTNTNSNLSVGKGFNYNKLWVDAVDSAVGGNSSVYIDNYKVYETPCIDNHAENEYNPDYDDEQGGETGDDNPEENLPEQAILNSYADINFDNWRTPESNLNSDDSSASLVWAGNAYNTKGVETVAEKDGNVYKFEMKPGTSGATAHYVRWRQGQNVNVPSQFGSGKVLWTEFSVKYENQFVGLGIEHDLAVAPFNINKSGKLEKFTVRGFNECGATNYSSYTRGKSIGNYQLELGKWYRFVIALDFTKDTGSGAPLYVWMNGQPIETGTDSNSNLSVGKSYKYNKLWVDAVDSQIGGTSSVYVDNYKVYETAQLDDHAKDEYETVKVVLNSTTYTVDGNKIHGFKGMTASDIKENALPSVPAKITIYESDGETVVSDDSVVQSGMIVKLSGSDGAQEVSYIFGDEHYRFNGIDVLVNRIGGTDIYRTGTIEAVADIANYSSEPVKLRTIIAKYSGIDNKLLGLEVVEETVGKGNASEVAKMDVAEYEGTYVKVFCVESDNMKPVGKVKELQAFCIDEVESIKFVYPGFVQKAVTFSYDDLNKSHDPSLISIFSKYGIKATFNLMTKRFSGPNNEISVDDARKMYKGFDTISHSYSHPRMSDTNMTFEDIKADIKRGQEDMTLLCGDETIGFVWPYADPTNRCDYQDIINFIKEETNIKYVRPTSTTGTFEYPENWYKWEPTCHHDNIGQYLPQFQNTDPDDELLLFSIWGHSNEFDVSVYPEPNKIRWNEIDEYAKILGEDDSIWKADNTEIYNYKTAIDNAVVDYENNTITNNSDVDIYVVVNGYNLVIPARSTYALIPEKTNIVACWGDSLTFGQGATDWQTKSYPGTLQGYLPDMKVYNMGIGGETSMTIAARQGGVIMKLDDDITIPADRTEVEIKFSAYNSDGTYAGVITPRSNTRAGWELVTIAGIEGTLTYETNTSKDPYTLNSAHFTRKEAGEAVDVDAGTVCVPSSVKTAHEADINIFFTGTNGGWNANNTLPYDSEADDLISLTDKMIAKTKDPSKYIVIGLIRGGTGSNAKTDAAMMAAYGNHFIDAKSYLASEQALIDAGITPSETDKSYILEGKIPPSLLHTDMGHLNDAGYKLLGQLVYGKMQELGYCD